MVWSHRATSRSLRAICRVSPQLNRETDKTIQSCALVIAEPNALVAEVDDRIPVVLDRNQFDVAGGEIAAFLDLCVPTIRFGIDAGNGRGKFAT